MRFGLHLLLTILLTAPALGQSGDDPFRFLRWPVNDLSAIPVGVSTNRLGWTVGAGAGLLALTLYDQSITDRVSDSGNAFGIRLVEEFGNAKTMKPATALLFIGALMTDDTRLQDATFTSLESLILANLITDLLKTAVGRARPWQNEGPASFEPFSGRSSFPSGHTTTAFAALTPFAVYYGNTTAAGLYLLATAAAASRVATNSHWFSDVVGGAAIGFLTAQVLSRRHRGMGGLRITPQLTPAGAGLQLRF